MLVSVESFPSVMVESLTAVESLSSKVEALLLSKVEALLSKVESLLSVSTRSRVILVKDMVGGRLRSNLAILCFIISTLACVLWPAPEAKMALLRAEGWPPPSGR